MLWFNYERSTTHSWRLACSNEAISYNWALHCKKLCAALCYSQGKSLENILVKRSHWILGRKEKNCQWRISLYLSLAFLRKLWDRHTWRKKFYIDNCFQKGNDNGRNYQADYVYFLLRLINLYHQSASPMHRTQNANAYFRFQTIRKNKWNGASLPRFENETQRFSSLCLLFICKDYHTRHVFSSVKELGRSEERQ